MGFFLFFYFIAIFHNVDHNVSIKSFHTSRYAMRSANRQNWHYQYLPIGYFQLRREEVYEMQETEVLLLFIV